MARSNFHIALPSAGVGRMAAAEAQIARLDAVHEARMAEAKKRRNKAMEFLDPTENANVFWQEFKEGKARVMSMLESAEESIKTKEGEGSSTSQDGQGQGEGEGNGKGAEGLAEAKAAAAVTLREASDLVGTLQGMVARASLFLPGYDQRLGNDSVMMMHQAVSQCRDRIFPREAFRFKSRKTPPADIATLMAQLRRDVGTTSGQDHLQGETASEELDPSLCFADRTGETLVKTPGQISGKDFVLTRLKGCTVFLLDSCGAVRADRLEDCKVYVGPVRSVLVEKLDRCTVAIAAQQLRIHSASECDFYVRMRSGPIIEHSSNVRFAPYNLAYPALEQQLAAASLAVDSGMWAKVEDFNWLRAQQSPNWSVIPEGDRAPLTAPPVTVSAGGDAAGDDGDEM